MKPPFLRLLALAAPLALASCVLSAPPSGGGVTTQPFSLPSSAGSSAASATSTPAPAGASPAGSLAPGVFFRDGFDGDKLDPARWKVYERTGVVRVKDGALDMLVSGRTERFPMVVPLKDVLPKEGPFYVELGYKFLSNGRLSSFNIDFLPPESDDDPGVIQPMVYWSLYQYNLNFVRRTETQNTGAVAPAGSLGLGVDRRFRLEFDGHSTYRLIYDKIELATFQSQRRARCFWFGATPNKPLPAGEWARWSIDYVESGALVTPDPAPPLATPTPKPTATPTPAPSAEPLASPSPASSASPAT